MSGAGVGCLHIPCWLTDFDPLHFVFVSLYKLVCSIQSLGFAFRTKGKHWRHPSWSTYQAHAV